MQRNETASPAKRLEELWGGEFGDAYIERNRAVGANRAPFWKEVMSRYRPCRVLEVGCNLGANLAWVASAIPPRDVYGVDINLKALEELRCRLPDVNALYGRAREMPFRDRFFDMVFTVGVLIHQPPDILPLVMSEIVRCSSRLVLCAEYFSQEREEVCYRGQSGALFKRDFGALYQQLFPELRLREKGFLGRADGWDDVTYWMFERS